MEVNVLEILKKTVPFNVLEDKVLFELAPELEVKTFPRDSYIIRQGKLGPPILYIVARGVAEVILTDEMNNETTVSLRYTHDFFGITSVVTHKSYPASVRAVEELTCILLPGAKLESLIISYPSFSSYFAGLLSERIRLLYKEVITHHQSHLEHSPTESPLLRKRVSEIMNKLPITCHYRTSITDVAQIMRDKRVSSVVVVDDKDYPIGIVREEDLVHKVLTRTDWQKETLIAGLVMDEKLVKLREGAFYNQALLAVIKHQVKHMVIMDGEKLVGVLTLRDLVNTRSAGSLWVTDKIESAQNLDHLVKIGQEVDHLLNALVAERASVPELFEIITEMHERLTCRIIELCELEMVARGYGLPPVDYCWLNMGSAGRKEQTLRTDQDNAIIYADGDRDHGDYFQTFGSIVVSELIRAGFAPCKGNVMASNPKWCHSKTQWKKLVDYWMNREEHDSVRMLTILLDFRPVFGLKNLGWELWNHIFDKFQTSLGLSHYLTEDEILRRVPLNVMGGFVTERKGEHKNQINLKVESRHIVNCFRVFAVSNRITETSTLGRISQIAKKGIISLEDSQMIQDAFETLMMLQIKENLNKMKQGLEVDNYINPYRLNKTEQLMLKGAFSAILSLQKITKEHFTDIARRTLSPVA